MRIARAFCLCNVALLMLRVSLAAAAPVSAAPSPAATPVAGLAPRLSSASGATEYWDVTAWLDSGERVLARFLVTNQGPGERTGAAVGHVVLANGRTLPFQWGRLHDQWTLGPGGRSLKIGKARLELAGPTVVVSVHSAKHGIDFRLEIDRRAEPVSVPSLAPGYALAVVMPASAHGRIQDRTVTGFGAVTHTSVDRPEGELLLRRLELFARSGDVALYVADFTPAGGPRGSVILVARDGHGLVVSGPIPLTLGATPTADGDRRYPLAAEWSATSPRLTLTVAVGRELLRMNPLDVLPQPFRLLLSLGGRPARVWAEATAELALTPPSADDNPRAPPRTHLRGITSATFARPED
jgi:hypothetical protein